MRCCKKLHRFYGRHTIWNCLTTSQGRAAWNRMAIRKRDATCSLYHPRARARVQISDYYVPHSAFYTFSRSVWKKLSWLSITVVERYSRIVWKRRVCGRLSVIHVCGQRVWTEYGRRSSILRHSINSYQTFNELETSLRVAVEWSHAEVE